MARAPQVGPDPELGPKFIVVTWECALCGQPGKDDWYSHSRLEYWEDKLCKECEDLKKGNPLVVRFIERLFEYRLKEKIE